MKKNVKWILVAVVAVGLVWWYMKKKKAAAYPAVPGVGTQMAAA